MPRRDRGWWKPVRVPSGFSFLTWLAAIPPLPLVLDLPPAGNSVYRSLALYQEPPPAFCPSASMDSSGRGMPLKGDNLGDPSGVENDGQFLVISGQLGMRMRVRGRGDRNLEFNGRSQN
jgi:hypothetical protein